MGAVFHCLPRQEASRGQALQRCNLSRSQEAREGRLRHVEVRTALPKCSLVAFRA